MELIAENFKMPPYLIVTVLGKGSSAVPCEHYETVNKNASFPLTNALESSHSVK
jgi:hypothetical protein